MAAPNSCARNERIGDGDGGGSGGNIAAVTEAIEPDMFDQPLRGQPLRDDDEGLLETTLVSGPVRTGGLLSIHRHCQGAAVVFRTLGVPELAYRLGLLSAAPAFRQLAGTSSGLWASLHEVLPLLPARAGAAVYICGGRHGGHGRTDTLRFDPSDGRWEPLEPMLTPRDGCAAAACGGCLYIVGGYGGGRVLATVERFHLADRRWERLPEMPTARLDSCAAAGGGHVYVAGGQCSGSPISAVERFDPSAWLWDELLPLPTPRRGCAAASLGGVLFVCGGAGPCAAPLGVVECFDMRRKCGQLGWSSLPPLLYPRFGCAATSSGKDLFVVGGTGVKAQPLKVVEKFDPAAGAWEALPCMSTARGCCTTATTGGKLYVMGGYSGDGWGGPLATCECMDISDTGDLGRDTVGRGWVPAPALPSGRGAACAAAVWY